MQLATSGHMPSGNMITRAFVITLIDLSIWVLTVAL